jgi:hypothetical protein
MGDRLGAAGRIGVPVAFAGTLLAVVNIGTEAFAMQLAPEALGDPSGYPLVVIIVSFALFSLGWLLVGVAAARSGLGSSPAAVLLIVGALIGFTPLPGSYVLMLAGIALTARTLTAGEPASVRGAASRTGAAHA